MFCVNCGTQLPDDSQFCTNCGFRLGQENPSASIQQGTSPSAQRVIYGQNTVRPASAVNYTQPAAMSFPQKDKTKPLLIIIAAVVILVAAVLIFFPKKGKETGPAKANDMAAYLGAWENTGTIHDYPTYFCKTPEMLHITERTVQVVGVGTNIQPSVTGDIDGVSKDSDGTTALHFTATYEDTLPENLENTTQDDIINGYVITDMYTYELRVFEDDDRMLRLEVKISDQWFPLGVYEKID